MWPTNPTRGDDLGASNGFRNLGTKAVARVAGQREDYLVKALRDYRPAVRAGGAMAAMADVALPLSEEEIESARALSGESNVIPALSKCGGLRVGATVLFTISIESYGPTFAGRCAAAFSNGR